MRTPVQIVDHCLAITGEDTFGWQRQTVIIYGLSFADAQRLGFVKPGTEDDGSWPEPSVERTEAAARGYLVFAIGKAIDHRGISASRSVEKLAAFAWLLGSDATVKSIHAADYAQYGAPQLKAFAIGMGWSGAWEVHATPELERMAEGRPCHDGCDDGCGT